MRHSSAFRTQLLGPLGISLMLSFVHKRLPAHEYRIQIVIKHVLFSAAYRSYLKLKAERLFANRCRKNQALTIHHLYLRSIFRLSIYYLFALTGSLKEANKDLRNQLINVNNSSDQTQSCDVISLFLFNIFQEREEEKRKVYALAHGLFTFLKLLGIFCLWFLCKNMSCSEFVAQTLELTRAVKPD